MGGCRVAGGAGRGYHGVTPLSKGMRAVMQ